MSTDIERAAATRAPQAAAARPGQATMVEQSRAQAEVHAAILVAQQSPRNIDRAEVAMRQVCSRKAMAERAFFSFVRAGDNVTGPTVHLARELARLWGNVQYGVSELSRDDVAGQSEMQAYAWDVETNTRVAAVFIVPHVRDTRRGRKQLSEQRDIYENNANAGARRVRECIYQVLPRWFTDEAADICAATLREGDGKPLDERIADAVRLFEAMSPPVTVGQLERHRGRARYKWGANDVAQLGTLYRSLQRGEITHDEAFPTQVVTSDEIAGGEPDTPMRADDPDLTAHMAGGDA